MNAIVGKGLPAGAAILTVIGLNGALLTPTAFADVAPTPTLTLTQAEHIAASSTLVPKDYTLQNQSFNSSGFGMQPPSYNFGYSNSTSNGTAGQYLNLSIDANTGLVLNYNRQSSDNKFVFPVPVSATQAQKIADQWAEKMYPKQYKEVKAMPLSPSYGALQGPTFYTFKYERLVGGIPAPFDGFSITIDQDGNLTALSDHWTNLTFPSTDSALSLTQANEVYQSALNLQLEYQSIYHSNAKPTVTLTYRTENSAYPNWWGATYADQNSIQYPVISATSGNVIDATGSKVQTNASNPLQPLVPGGPTASAKPVKVNWSESQAMNYAKKLFGISASDTLQNVNQYQNPGAPVSWSFSWVTANQMNVNVNINATYGTLQNYYVYPSVPTQSSSAATPQVKWTQTEINQKVDDFVKEVLANDTGAIAVIPAGGNPMTGQLQTRFSIVSLVNGIPDQSHSSYVNFDERTGMITNFSGNDYSVGTTYPDPSKAMSESKAVQDWMTKRPLTLEYLETQPQSAVKIYGRPMNNVKTPQAPQIELVYAPTAPQSATGVFNAITGEFENNNAKTPFTGQIMDLGGVPAAPQMRLLVQRELISVDSHGDVHPNENLTHSAFVKLVVAALGAQGRINPQVLQSADAKAALASVSSSSPNYQDIQAAYSMGLIPTKQPFAPNALTTRDYAAQVLAKAMNFGPLLSYPDAFKFTAKDASSISQDHVAGDALATSLGLLPLVNGDFNPTQNITLANAAVAIVKAASTIGGQALYGPRPMG
jgi:hypothetical protein